MIKLTHSFPLDYLSSSWILLAKDPCISGGGRMLLRLWVHDKYIKYSRVPETCPNSVVLCCKHHFHSLLSHVLYRTLCGTSPVWSFPYALRSGTYGLYRETLWNTMAKTSGVVSRPGYRILRVRLREDGSSTQSKSVNNSYSTFLQPYRIWVSGSFPQSVCPRACMSTLSY